MPSSSKGFVFINKDAGSPQLSRSTGRERDSIYRHVQPLRSHAAGESSTELPTRRRRRRQNLPATRQNQDANDTAGHHYRTPPRAPIFLPALPAGPQSCPAYRYQLKSFFVEENMSALRHQTDFAEIESFFWIRHIPSLQDNNDAVGLSCVALAGVACGQDRADQQLINASTSFYVKALAALAHDLSTSRGRASDQTIAATLALLMYQFFAPKGSGRREWGVHIDGLQSLLYLRGPHCFQEGLSHALFLSCRPNIISASMHARRATFLATDIWRRIPWMERKKSSYQQLLDRLTEVPGLGEQFNAIAEMTDPLARTDRRVLLLEELWAAVDSILQWLQPASARVNPTAVRPTLDETLLGSKDQYCPFPFSFEFASMASASMCRAAWAFLIDVSQLLNGRKAGPDSHGLCMDF